MVLTIPKISTILTVAPRVVGVFALCLLLAGCSSATIFFYNRLPNILPWYLGRYIDLNNAQEEQFDLQLFALLEWHRRDELPRYVRLLDQVLAQLDEPVTAAGIAVLADEAEQAWLRLRDLGLDELLVLGASFSDQQIDDFIIRLEEKQKKYEGKYLTRDDDEYREDASDNLLETLEDYMGRLDESQRDRVTSAAESLVRSDRLWLAERQRGTDMLRRELQREAGWQLRLREEVIQWEARLDSESSIAYEYNTRTVQTAIAAVIDARSERQDVRLRKKISTLREDLAELAADVNPN
jgi:hypothetical protein